MSRKLVVAALAAACLIGAAACGSAGAESPVKSSKPKAGQTTKPRGQGQSGGTTTDRGSNAGGRGDSEYGR